MSEQIVTLHRNCSCVNDGYAPDGMYSDHPCTRCEEALGFDVPIVVDEGRLSHHLNCPPEVRP